MPVDLSVLIVHYHAEEFLPGLIGSIEAFLTGRQAEILIWDNGSRNGKPDALSSSGSLGWYPSVTNIGFARGHLALAKKASGRWFLIVNPDARFAPESLEKLWSAAAENPKVGIVVPKTVYPDGRLQVSVFAPASFEVDLFHSLGLRKLASILPSRRRLFKQLTSSESPFPVGWASGACFLVSRPAWEKTGGFDPSFFFGGEDIDFCQRVWASGFDVLCEPRALLRHQGSQSLQNEAGNKILYYYQKRLYFAHKHFSRLQYFIITTVSVCELAGKWLVAFLLPVSRAKWTDKRRGYARALRLIFDRHYRHPGEWVGDWVNGIFLRMKATV